MKRSVRFDSFAGNTTPRSATMQASPHLRTAIHHGWIPLLAGLALVAVWQAAQLASRWIDPVFPVLMCALRGPSSTSLPSAGYQSLWLVSVLLFVGATWAGVVGPLVAAYLSKTNRARWGLTPLVTFAMTLTCMASIHIVTFAYYGEDRYIYFDSALLPVQGTGTLASWIQVGTDTLGTLSLTLSYAFGVQLLALKGPVYDPTVRMQLDRLTATVSVVGVIAIVEVYALYSWSLARMTAPPSAGDKFPAQCAVFVKSMTGCAGGTLSMLLVSLYAYGISRVSGGMWWTQAGKSEQRAAGLATLAPVMASLIATFAS